MRVEGNQLHPVCFMQKKKGHSPILSQTNPSSGRSAPKKFDFWVSISLGPGPKTRATRNNQKHTWAVLDNLLTSQSFKNSLVGARPAPMYDLGGVDLKTTPNHTSDNPLAADKSLEPDLSLTWARLEPDLSRTWEKPQIVKSGSSLAQVRLKSGSSLV